MLKYYIDCGRVEAVPEASLAHASCLTFGSELAILDERVLSALMAYTQPRVSMLLQSLPLSYLMSLMLYKLDITLFCMA